MARLRRRTSDNKCWAFVRTIIKLELMSKKKLGTYRKVIFRNVIDIWCDEMFKMNKKRYKDATKQK